MPLTSFFQMLTNSKIMNMKITFFYIFIIRNVDVFRTNLFKKTNSIFPYILIEHATRIYNFRRSKMYLGSKNQKSLIGSFDEFKA